MAAVAATPLTGEQPAWRPVYGFRRRRESLPVDPPALRRALAARGPATLNRIGALLGETVATPELRAVLYEVPAHQPDIETYAVSPTSSVEPVTGLLPASTGGGSS
ncbi:MAG TPA: hypothetical protein VIJ66_11535 [Solirubrobacteraceae bacterium]